MKAALAAVLLLASQAAFGQTETVIKAARGGYAIAGLVSHLEGATKFRRGVALFPGHPGILRLEVADGQPRFEMRGNFLVRSRRHWLDAETLVVAIDAPSDEWTDFSQYFRSTARYGADVRALLEEVGRRYPVRDWTFVGTSEGSISAAHAARMNPELARRLILTSSLFSPTRDGPGLSSIDWRELQMPILWVHHEADPCPYTTYADARRFAQKTASPLVTVHGGGPYRGGACQAFSAHGYVGVEREAVLAMRAWIAGGSAPSDVRP